jgi:hypothetical protein
MLYVKNVIAKTEQLNCIHAHMIVTYTATIQKTVIVAQHVLKIVATTYKELIK